MRSTEWLNRIENGDVPHAILFAGPKESEQLSLARHAAARYLLHTDDSQALDESPYFIQPTDRSIDAIRDALALVNAQAYGRGRRCILFADAHEMSEASQDVLLKTLEEPPSDTLLLLTGTESGLRPTILSRCMILRTESEPWEAIQKRLIARGVASDSAECAAKLSDGIMGRATAFLDADYQAFRAGAIECIAKFPSRAKPYAALTALCTDSVEEESTDSAIKKGKKVSADKLDALLNVFLSILSDVLRQKNGIADVRNTDCTALEKNFTAAFTISQIQCMIQNATEAKEMLTYKASPALTVDWILAKLP
jgi:DNA polymerase III gamma/tau subunit